MPPAHATELRCGFLRAAVVAVCFGFAAATHAQLQFTEVMHSPIGDPNRWEWVEVRNTSSSAVDLDGWIFDDDDGLPVSMSAVSNIKAANGNTIIPTGGVAVLYAGSDLAFTPSRFTNAWGAGVPLIPVNNLTSLTAADAIGLWPSRPAYDADSVSSPRSFAHAAVSLDYGDDFPEAESGHSMAWTGSGSFASGANWVPSEANVLQAKVSTRTTFESVPINGADRGNPGVVPGGISPPGLRITEVMYHPASSGPGWGHCPNRVLL